MRGGSIIIWEGFLNFLASALAVSVLAAFAEKTPEWGLAITVVQTLALCAGPYWLWHTSRRLTLAEQPLPRLLGMNSRTWSLLLFWVYAVSLLRRFMGIIFH